MRDHIKLLIPRVEYCFNVKIIFIKQLALCIMMYGVLWKFCIFCSPYILWVKHKSSIVLRAIWQSRQNVNGELLKSVSWKNRIKDHWITVSRIKDQGSVQNEWNKLNKLIGVIDCSSSWLSQDLPYAKAKIRENTEYWKSHTNLWKCQFSPTDF